MKKHVFVAVILAMALVGTPTVEAGSISFDFQDPKGVNSISIVLDSRLEPIRGFATGISGNVVFDPEKPVATAGNIVVATDKITMANPRMTKMLHSEEWINVKAHPTVEFTLRKVVSATVVADQTHQLLVTGDFTCKGVTKEIEVPVSLNYFPGTLKARNHEGEGDLLVLRTQFIIDRGAFNIMPGQYPGIVADDIEINVGIVGFAPKVEQKKRK